MNQSPRESPSRTRSFEGQVALVTGGGSGIGRAVALALASRGVAVVVTGRTEKTIAETVGEIAYGGGRARHVVGDVRDAAHLAAAVGRATSDFGRLDIVVANAGQTGRTPLGGGAGVDGAGDADANALMRAIDILDTNLRGTYQTFDAAVRAMTGPGRLIATSSVLGRVGASGYAAYCASKAGILGMCRAVALEVAPRGITCNAVVPGWVETDLADAALDEVAVAVAVQKKNAPSDALRAAVRRDAIGKVPLGRFISPDEVADLVVFLASSAADAITGQAVAICGGATAFG